MLKYLLFFILVFISSISSHGQGVSFHIGAKGGVSKYDVGIGNLLIQELDSIKVSVADQKFGFHGGITIQLRINSFFIQPEVIFNSSKISYSISGNKGNLKDSILLETYKNIDIPLMFGIKKSALRINAGPVGHLHLNSSSELFEINGYSQNFKKLQWGWQAGFGLDIWKFTIDVRYEGNFNRFGNHITFFGHQYAFSDTPTRLIGSLGLQF